MAPLWLSALLPVFLATAGAQDSNEKVWAVVAFVNNGERTPLIGDIQTVLTPDGAQQMQRQGAAFRMRYLGGAQTASNSSANHTIRGIDTQTIDNTHLSLLSQDDSWVAAGATAFTQGLYPPNNDTLNPHAGGDDMTTNLVANTTSSGYPLGGYQYPLIETLSNLDSRSIAVQGTVGCATWLQNASGNQTDRADQYYKSQAFYQKVFGEEPLKGTVPLSEANFYNAYELYDYVNYMYMHNETVHEGLSIASEWLPHLREHALELEMLTSAEASNTKNTTENELRTIAGRTFSWAAADAFVQFLGKTSSDDSLNVMFGSFRPLLSFFSLAGFLSESSTDSGPLSKIPEPGAALVFELVGEDADYPEQRPTMEDLMVRTYYRATADADASFELLSLFNSGFDGNSMPYTAFARRMQELGATASDWCTICRPTKSAAPWCSAFSNSTTHSSSPTVSAPVAGVIGAVIMVALVGLATVALYFLAGFRLARRDGSGKNKPGQHRSGTLGGFKGAQRMASDTDLTVGKSGAQEERVGSWELKGDGDEVESGAARQNEGHTAGIVTDSFRRDDDGISVLESPPVRAHEGV